MCAWDLGHSEQRTQLSGHYPYTLGPSKSENAGTEPELSLNLLVLPLLPPILAGLLPRGGAGLASLGVSLGCEGKERSIMSRNFQNRSIQPPVFIITQEVAKAM